MESVSTAHASDDSPQARRWSPIDEYGNRLAARRDAHARWTRLDGHLSNARLATVAIALVLIGAVYGARILGAWCLALPALAFGGLAVRHEHVIDARDALQRSIAIYERALARVEDRWMGSGEQGRRFLDEGHPYAQDLDLFGQGSLFELLSLAQTRVGEETLARWLTHSPPVTEVRARQEAVSELRDRIDLREALAGDGAGGASAVDTSTFVAWTTTPPILTMEWPRFVAAALTVCVVASGAWWAWDGPSWPLELFVLGQIAFAQVFKRQITQVLHGAGRQRLEVIADAFAQMEREPVESSRLRGLRRAMMSDGGPASAAIRRLQTLFVLYDWRLNLLFAPIAGVLLWNAQLAWAAEKWRRDFGAHVPGWFAALGEFEALISLAGYAYEHPADPFPELREGAAAHFDGLALGHPLIPAAQMVRNDVQLTAATPMLVISGSNMSGKSTLLRTVGINAVLALAGAPVRAKQLAITQVAVGATLRIEDSLQAGRSRFYAEIARLRQLTDIARGGIPLLFLLDELFHGTSSHDRVVGAVGVLRSLLDAGSIGLVTTHDLALTAITDTVGHGASNTHFDDQLEADELTFDYRMKPGPVTKSNGLTLMRAVGLDVQEQ